MDAKERLRLYLEQRRELGDTELMLDALPVDDVLRMIGARAAAAASGPAATPAGANAANHQVPIARNADVAPTAPVIERAPAPPVTEPRIANDAAGNWRDTLGKPVTASRPSSSPLPGWLASLDLPEGLNIDAPTDGAAHRLSVTLDSIDAVASAIASCRLCPLGASALNPVPGEGNPDADFVCVGEAPGASEDETGRPFVGASGQLLTKILGAIQLERSDVFICNVLKHRPPGNRDPAPDEVRACAPYLARQLELLKPRVILALGTFAAQALLATTTSVGKLRGQVHRYHGIPLIVTYHPSALLRNESWKRPTWDDVRLARRILDASRAAQSTR